LRTLKPGISGAKAVRSREESRVIGREWQRLLRLVWREDDVQVSEHSFSRSRLNNLRVCFLCLAAATASTWQVPGASDK
jgi:hypothetical protein